LESSLFIDLLNEYKVVLIFQFLVILAVTYCSARLPSLDLTPKNVSVKRRGTGKKLLWTFSAPLFVVLITIGVVYQNARDARKNAISLSLINNRLIEFPNAIGKMERNLYIPFRCQFPENKIRAKFFRYNRGKKENINRKIDQHKDATQAARVSLTGNGEFLWIDGGSADVNIPISASCIRNGQVKILISLFDGSTETFSVPFVFETLAPVPETRNAWIISSEITQSEIGVNAGTKLSLNVVNNGSEGMFRFILNILDPATRKVIPKDMYNLQTPAELAVTLQHGRTHRNEWPIMFKKSGLYLLSASVEKKIDYLNLPINRKNWENSYNHQNLLITVGDNTAHGKQTETLSAKTTGNASVATKEKTAGDHSLQPAMETIDLVFFFEIETQRGGGVLYEGPSEQSGIMVTNIRQGANVKVYGKGRNAWEVIANSDRYVRTEVTKLNKTGYMDKKYFIIN